MTADRHAQDCLAPGTHLLQGQFLIDRFLNAGGFGITYLARDSLDRRVVIKECYPSAMCCRRNDLVQARSRAHQTEFDAIVRLFGQEARRLAKLDHPNIVGVRDVFEDNGTAYMALDFVDGRDLLDLIQQDPGRLGPDDIKVILVKILDAVAHVHAQGMLHRDISPDNILLSRKNEPVLIDFGAARDTARNASRTLSAIRVVKDGYSPQEFYLSGTEQSPASDLYSLAATLYHILIGEAPVQSQTRLAALAEQKSDPYIPLTGRVAGYERAFLNAIDVTLSIFSKDRLQTAAAWLAEIDGIPEGAILPGHAIEESAIASTITKLVAETNVVVQQEQEKARAEAEVAARARAEARAAAEERRRRVLEQAQAEAAEAAAIAAERATEAATAADPESGDVKTRSGWFSWLFGGPRSRSSVGQVPHIGG